MSSGNGHGKIKIEEEDGHLDLVPLIDCVFLILLFFMLCGRISTDQRSEQITVPPTKTAAKLEHDPAWTYAVVNVYGSTQAGREPRNSIQWGADPVWQTKASDEGADSAYFGYQQLRQKLDEVYDSSSKYDDPKYDPKNGGTPLQLPKVVVEVRADGDTEYRVVQEVMQIMTDTINPFKDPQTGSYMQPKAPVKPFVNIYYTTRRPGEK